MFAEKVALALDFALQMAGINLLTSRVALEGPRGQLQCLPIKLLTVRNLQFRGGTKESSCSKAVTVC